MQVKKIRCEVKRHPIFLLFEVYNFYVVFQGFVYRVISAAARSAVVVGKQKRAVFYQIIVAEKHTVFKICALFPGDIVGICKALVV